MRVALATILGAVGLTACSPSHEFVIDSDQPMQKVEVKLANVRKSKVTIDNPRRARVALWTSDSSGEIEVELASGKRVICSIGYITNGIEQPSLLIEDGECRETVPA